MTIEHKSCGVVPVRRQGRDWEFFIVQHKTGNWAFPKGHQEPGETDEQTARRELAEETGIHQVELYLAETFIEDYTWEREGVKNHKIATYFLGLVQDHKIAIQQEELADGRWIPNDEVEGVLTFPASQNVFRQARKVLLKEYLWE